MPDALNRPRPALHRSDLIGRKWAPEIVSALRSGPRRFSELRTGIPGLGDTVLSRRLAELEWAGIVSRAQFPEIPPRVEYTLTATGLTVERMLAAIECRGRNSGAHTTDGEPHTGAASTGEIETPGASRPTLCTNPSDPATKTRRPSR